MGNTKIPLPTTTLILHIIPTVIADNLVHSLHHFPILDLYNPCQEPYSDEYLSRLCPKGLLMVQWLLAMRQTEYQQRDP